MEDVPGILLAELDESGREPAVEAAGRALAKLHRCPLEVPGRYSAKEEVELLEGWGAVVSQVHPGMKAAFAEAFAEVRDALEGCRSVEPTLVHRDFYEKQVLVDGTQAILIDFDTLCLADPAIDVGNFLAHLRLAGLQHLGRVKRLEEAFLAAYRPMPSQDLQARVRAYTMSSLLRLACLYSLWPQWSHLAEPLLEALHEP
jgi:aminoglycoside phosphotransferase (APT) family kinase protein